LEDCSIGETVTEDRCTILLLNKLTFKDLNSLLIFHDF